MTTFNKADFSFDGMYLTYGPDRRFVARFKYMPRDRGPFVKLLAANFSVEDYFAAIDAGKAPLAILAERGLELPRITRARAEQAQYAALKAAVATA